MGWATLMENDKGRDKSARESIKRQDIFIGRSTSSTLPLTVGPGSPRCHHAGSKRGTAGHALHPLTILTALVGFARIAFSFSCVMDSPVA